MMSYQVIVLALVAAAQTAVLWRLWGQIRRASRDNDRLAHFAEALALLTDTTEAGLANVASELESSRRRAPRATSRAATAKRIVSAVRRGRSLEEIGTTEGISEGEIRLHLEMARDEA